MVGTIVVITNFYCGGEYYDVLEYRWTTRLSKHICLDVFGTQPRDMQLLSPGKAVAAQDLWKPSPHGWSKVERVRRLALKLFGYMGMIQNQHEYPWTSFNPTNEKPMTRPYPYIYFFLHIEPGHSMPDFRVPPCPENCPAIGSTRPCGRNIQAICWNDPWHHLPKLLTSNTLRTGIDGPKK